MKLKACAAGAAFAFLLTSSPALAQGARVGGTFFPKPFDGQTTRFPAVAYDAASQSYLIAWGIHNVGARFVSTAGAPLGTPVSVNTVDGGAAGVACASAAANMCLVTWIEEPGSVMGRLVRSSGGNVQMLTAPFAVNRGIVKLTSTAPSVAFSTSTSEFLVAWTDGDSNVRGQRVSTAAALLGEQIPIATTANWEGFASVTYNAARNEFVASYYTESATCASCVYLTRVQPGTGFVLGNGAMYGSLFEQYPALAYNSRDDEFFAVTWNIGAGGWMLHGQRANGAGQPIGGILALAPQGGGDGVGLAYNPATNSYLALFIRPDNSEIWGVCINAAGVPGTQFQVTVSGTRLATQPRPAGDPSSSKFLAIASENFGRVMGQLVQDGTSADPAAGPATPPPPAAPVTNPAIFIDTPRSGAQSQGNFVVAGWALDAGAPTGTGIDLIQAWAYPSTGAPPQFFGTAKYGISRPDVGALFGARFNNVGYAITGTIASPGTYDIIVFAHSTVTNAFTITKAVRVVVTQPVSRPAMWVDLPAKNSVVGRTFTVAGWAIDLAAGRTDTGVLDVHVWAYPSTGAAPILVGVASYGTARPDVAAAFGAARFAPSGFFVVGTLPVGDYNMVTFARSKVTGTFNNVIVTPLHVR